MAQLCGSRIEYETPTNHYPCITFCQSTQFCFSWWCVIILHASQEHDQYEEKKWYIEVSRSPYGPAHLPKLVFPGFENLLQQINLQFTTDTNKNV